MKKIKEFKEYLSTKKIFLAMFFLLLMVLGMPLMQNDINVADDYLFHFSRIQSITDTLAKGIFPVKIHFPMACNCGYGSGFFYPNLFLYIPAIINLIITNVSVSYKIFLGIYLALFFAVSYFSIKAVSKDKKVALFASILIMLSNGLMLNLYNRTALGELLGFFFITPLICGLYNFVHDDFDKPYLIALGFIGVLNSHLITTIICITFSIIYVLVNIKKVISKPKNILKLLGVAIIVLLITSAFWVPMLEQLLDQTFKLSNSWTVIKNDGFYLLDLFGTGKHSLGIVLTLLMPLLIYGVCDKKVDKSFRVLGGFSLLFMFLMVFSPFWNLTNDYTNIIQFKWRLLGITTILTCISIAYLIIYYLKEWNIKFEYGFAVIVVCSFAYAIVNMNAIIDSHDTYTNDYIETIMYEVPEAIGGGQEYLPEKMEYSRLLIEQNIATNNNEMKLPVVKDGLTASVDIVTDYHCSFLEIPFIYYKGYVANITSSDGVVTPLDVEETEDGLVKVIIPNELVGKVMVWYNGTQIQKISYLVTFGTTALVVLGYIVCFAKNKKNKKSLKNDKVEN